MANVQYQTTKSEKKVVCIWTTVLLTIASGTAMAQPQTQEETQPSMSAEPAEDVHIVTDENAARWIEFQNCVRDWRAESSAMSSVTAMSMLRPYQKIIGMGLSAIPLILTELRAEGDDPDQWFWALSVIAEANHLIPPKIDPALVGDYRAMAQAWLEWGRHQFYVG